MESRTFPHAYRNERTMEILRGLLALALITSLFVMRVPIQNERLWAISVLGVALFVVAAIVFIVAWSFAKTTADLDRLGVFGLMVDTPILAIVPVIAVAVDPAATIAWSILLWIPLSAGVRFGSPGALVATGGTMAIVLGAWAMGAVATTWTSLGMPLMLLFVTGFAISAVTFCQRGAVADVQLALRDERSRIIELERADELKNTFLAALSHEMRTPLTSILGFAVTLLDRDDLTEKQRDAMLRTLVDEAEVLEDILANMLDLDRLTRGIVTMVPVRVSVDEIVQSVTRRVMLRSGRDIETDLQPGIRLAIDVPKVERIVENLVGNAVKYTAPGVQISVGLERHDEGVLIRVDDRGAGIAPELRAEIFEPFRRGDNEGVAGTGIGLSLVDKFSQMHGGRAWVEELPGGGARFLVYLADIGHLEPASSSKPTGSGVPGILRR